MHETTIEITGWAVDTTGFGGHSVTHRTGNACPTL